MVEPYWGELEVGGVLKPDVTRWVTGMHAAGVGAATIQAAVGVLRALFELAVDARMIRTNPARGVKTPRRPAHVDRVLTFEEEDRLLAALEGKFGVRPDGRMFVELLLDTGLRWSEAAAIDREHVDLRRGLINVGPIMERDGTIRPYPKSAAGVRPVPVGEDLWPRFRDHVLTVAPGGLVFTAVLGGVLRLAGRHGLGGQNPAGRGWRASPRNHGADGSFEPEVGAAVPARRRRPVRPRPGGEAQSS